jgi:rod shape-determining protein MreD
VNFSAWARGAVVLLILLMLHYTLRPLLGWRAPIDFLLIAVLLGAVRVRPGTAAVCGFFVGMASDALSPGGFGSGALAMSLVAYGASRLRAVFFADNLLLHAIFFFFGKWGQDVILVISERGFGGPQVLSQLLLWSPLSAALTAMTGVLLLVLLRPIIEPSRA